MPAPVFARDQHRQLERVDEVERRELLRRRLGGKQVPSLERLTKDRSGVALRQDAERVGDLIDLGELEGRGSGAPVDNCDSS
jgi:hypothetical protein